MNSLNTYFTKHYVTPAPTDRPKNVGYRNREKKLGCRNWKRKVCTGITPYLFSLLEKELFKLFIAIQIKIEVRRACLDPVHRA